MPQTSEETSQQAPEVQTSQQTPEDKVLSDRRTVVSGTVGGFLLGINFKQFSDSLTTVVTTRKERSLREPEQTIMKEKSLRDLEQQILMVDRLKQGKMLREVLGLEGTTIIGMESSGMGGGMGEKGKEWTEKTHRNSLKLILDRVILLTQKVEETEKLAFQGEEDTFQKRFSEKRFAQQGKSSSLEKDSPSDSEASITMFGEIRSREASREILPSFILEQEFNFLLGKNSANVKADDRKYSENVRMWYEEAGAIFEMDDYYDRGSVLGIEGQRVLARVVLGTTVQETGPETGPDGPSDGVSESKTDIEVAIRERTTGQVLAERRASFELN